MRFVCDIDGVLSRGNPRTFASLLNSALKLELGEEELAHMDTFLAFDQHPRVRAYSAEIGAAAFAQRKAVLGLVPSYMLTCQMTPDALEALAMLDNEGGVSYCTCRKTEKSAFNEQIAQATRAWLAARGFPHPERVLFCRTTAQKLEVLSDVLAEESERIVFIEDQYQKVLTALPTLSEARQEQLRRSLILWAFGAEENTLPSGTQALAGLVALPSWSHVAEALAASRESVMQA